VRERGREEARIHLEAQAEFRRGRGWIEAGFQSRCNSWGRSRKAETAGMLTSVWIIHVCDDFDPIRSTTDEH
jgi:hypothetical protein